MNFEDNIEIVCKIIDNLTQVIEPDGISRWFNLSIPALGGLTPIEAFERGKGEEVLQVTESYLDPSYS